VVRFVQHLCTFNLKKTYTCTIVTSVFVIANSFSDNIITVAVYRMVFPSKIRLIWH